MAVGPSLTLTSDLGSFCKFLRRLTHASHILNLLLTRTEETRLRQILTTTCLGRCVAWQEPWAYSLFQLAVMCLPSEAGESGQAGKGTARADAQSLDGGGKQRRQMNTASTG